MIIINDVFCYRHPHRYSVRINSGRVEVYGQLTAKKCAIFGAFPVLRSAGGLVPEETHQIDLLAASTLTFDAPKQAPY